MEHGGVCHKILIRGLNQRGRDTMWRRYGNLWKGVGLIKA